MAHKPSLPHRSTSGATVLTHPTAETVSVSTQTLIQIADSTKNAEAISALSGQFHELVSLLQAVLTDARRGVVPKAASDGFELLALRLEHEANDGLEQLRTDNEWIHDKALELVVGVA